MRSFISDKAARFTESVIREMTRLANQHDAINLAQGFPDFPASDGLKQAASDAIHRDVNQYAITWGSKNLREALARKYARFNGMAPDPERMITVTCGATEAMIAALLATVNPGEEVVIFEPYYENYGPDAILSGATPRFVPLHPPDWRFDEKEIERAFNSRTRAIIINTPNNPTGKVFTRAELEFIARLCRKHDVLAVTDEVYEHIVYPGAKHVSMATLDGMEERTITTSALSKTFCITGWRIGTIVAPPGISGAVRKVHDFLTVGAPHPLQEAAAWLLDHAGDYFDRLGGEYLERRNVFFEGARSAGLELAREPEGAYYVMCDIRKYGAKDDTQFAQWLVKVIGVAVVPGSSFYQDPGKGHGQVRFSYCKKLETLREACRRLARLCG
ncbi:MAG TPA: aminotransferase class I/II-fold pyridoxal phosphate-dependent enzyme [Planctomycetota bacterium]|nr:aminotransferase class I/II-fold pyridoxal phosphate-dependent enzyme [Planctomycetota bacterium]